MRLVCIESPYGGKPDNLIYARRVMLDSIFRGEAPYLSHLLYPQVLDDYDLADRAFGIQAGHAWLLKADLVAFYGDLGWSSGMKSARDLATKHAVPIEHRLIGVR